MLSTGRKVLRPTVDVELAFADLKITTKALIDTGAPRTVFPRGVGDVLGIDFPDVGTVQIDLMGRRWPATTASVSLLLRPFDDLGWEAEVDFVLDEGLPFGLLWWSSRPRTSMRGFRPTTMRKCSAAGRTPTVHSRLPCPSDQPDLGTSAARCGSREE